MSDESADRTRRVRPVLEYPCTPIPESGQTLEVAPGVLWIRMPLPFALANINLWAIADGDRWTIVDTGIQTPETAAAWREVLAGPLVDADSRA
jgi:glyoxylase-like metal-dependent hydrolase (beta-lactamase superfamily II)